MSFTCAGGVSFTCAGGVSFTCAGGVSFTCAGGVSFTCAGGVRAGGHCSVVEHWWLKSGTLGLIPVDC